MALDQHHLGDLPAAARCPRGRGLTPWRGMSRSPPSRLGSCWLVSVACLMVSGGDRCRLASRSRSSLTEAAAPCWRSMTLQPSSTRTSSSHEKAGLPISTADAQIAAICPSRNATCATRNTRASRILIDPWSAAGMA